MRRLALAVVVGLSLSGCGATDADTSPPEPSGPALAGDITVLAASSLTDPFTALGEQFEAANPEVHVTFSFAASSALATQIAGGAPADVFASASTVIMDEVVASGAATDPVVFAANRMMIAVPRANPGKVTSLDDLADPAITVALCQPQVPCGSTAEKVFANAGMTVTPVTLEPDVKAVLSKVQLGEVDAGVVYFTDVFASDTVWAIEIRADVNAWTDYPIAALTDSKNSAVAGAFVDYVLSGAGAAVLADAGFEQYVAATDALR